MATVSTPLSGLAPSTPKLSGNAKLTQIKPAQNRQSSPPPLKFRSFDAFYQHYSKKLSTENALHRGPHIPHPANDTALADKESERNAQKSAVESPKANVTWTTEDYNIQGRVKRLCEIFQRAHDNSDYRARLQKVISKNKAPKSEKGRAPGSDITSAKDVPPAQPSATLKPIKKPGGDGRIQADPAPLESHRASLGTSEAPSDAEFGPASFQDSLESPYNPLPPLEIFPFESNPNIVTRQTGRPVDSDAAAERDAMIDGVLTRFINDPEFCDSFCHRLESLNLANHGNSARISRIVDELQFLVDADGPNALSRMDSEENRKLFDWFFNQPKVFDFDDAEQSEGADQASPEAGQPDPLTERLDLVEPAGSKPESDAAADPELPELDDEDDFNSHLAGQFDWFTKQQ